MPDNLSVTPGTGALLPTKELTHSGSTVQAQIVELGIDNGTALTRLQGGRKDADGSLPVVQSANQVERFYQRVAFGSIPSSFTTIIDPTAGFQLDLIEGVNTTNRDIEITYGSDTNPKHFIPAGASFSENLGDLGLMEARVVKYRYVSSAPTVGYFMIRALGR